jgi:hydroxyacylglutathione hydrolase
MVFTGDALFAGDVGRVDLVGRDRIKEMAGKLYDSIYGKILPYGDGVILCPAHGAGSVCGDTIAERGWSTIGLEKKYNPKLIVDNRDAFIKKVSKGLDYPPYFRMMERMNLLGMAPPCKFSAPIAYGPKEFKEISGKSFVIDTSMELGFGSAHVPGSMSIWTAGMPSFAGWFIPYDRDILIVSEPEELERTMAYLHRLGYDNIKGYLSKGMTGWHMSGLESGHIATTTVQELCKEIDRDKDRYILDVRDIGEIEEEGMIPNAKHIHITELTKRMREVPKDKKVHIFCGSGLRSMTAASLLRKNGWDDLVVMLGGISSWNSLTCPLDKD